MKEEEKKKEGGDIVLTAGVEPNRLVRCYSGLQRLQQAHVALEWSRCDCFYSGPSRGLVGDVQRLLVHATCVWCLAGAGQSVYSMLHHVDDIWKGYLR